jgi:hypothetical protein
MDPSFTRSHTAALLGRLGTVVPPGLAPFVAPPDAAATAAREIAFRFSYRELSCAAVVEREESAATLRAVGDFGPLPYTVEGASLRRRALQIVAAAKRDTGFDWRLSPVQSIVFAGHVALEPSLTPSEIIAGVVGLLLRADGYIGLLLEVLGERNPITSPRAA